MTQPRLACNIFAFLITTLFYSLILCDTKVEAASSIKLIVKPESYTIRRPFTLICQLESPQRLTIPYKVNFEQDGQAIGSYDVLDDQMINWSSEVSYIRQGEALYPRFSATVGSDSTQNRGRYTCSLVSSDTQLKRSLSWSTEENVRKSSPVAILLGISILVLIKYIPAVWLLWSK